MMKIILPKEFESERLQLRLPIKSDFALMRQYIDPPIMRKYAFIRYGHPDLYPDIYLGPARKDWKAGTAYRTSVVLKETNTMIGHMMLFSVNKTNRSAEIGYWMGKDYWGRGYTKEATIMMLKFGFNKLKLRRIYAQVIGGNETSIKLLEKLGFQLEMRARKHEMIRGRYHDVLTFGLLSEEFF